MKHAVIYCRVSSQRQVREGNGLESQEQRCRKYAKDNGYVVVKVFPDEGVSGSLFDRPAMKNLISFLDYNSSKNYFIIFDDLSRFARDAKVHLQMRMELASRGAKLKCLNYNFDDSPEGEFIELVMAGKHELDRKQNTRQVNQKMRARLESGYWCFKPVAGYEYIKHPLHGKILSPKEPNSSIVKEGLERFANGILETKLDFMRFLNEKDFTPQSAKKLCLQSVDTILSHILYTGYIHYPKWDISMTEGHHEALISMETYNKIQNRLKSKVKTKKRADIHLDFPARGFALCEDCKTTMTASFSKGRKQHYPYYHCRNKKCVARWKGIAKNTLEKDLLNTMKAMKPKEESLRLLKAILCDVWQKKLKQKEVDQKKNRKKTSKYSPRTRKSLRINFKGF